MKSCDNKEHRPTGPYSNCRQCGEKLPYSKTRFNAKYCSSGCRLEKAKEKYRKANKRPKISNGSRGATSELKVTVDLLEKGWSVFRSVNQHAPCDLVAVKEKAVIRIEVKTGFYFGPEGEVCKVGHSKVNEENFDVLAVVTYKEIVYYPESF